MECVLGRRERERVGVKKEGCCGDDSTGGDVHGGCWKRGQRETGIRVS